MLRPGPRTRQGRGAQRPGGTAGGDGMSLHPDRGAAHVSVRLSKSVAF